MNIISPALPSLRLGVSVYASVVILSGQVGGQQAETLTDIEAQACTVEN